MRPISNVVLIDNDPIFNLINERMIQLSTFAPKVTSFEDARNALEYLEILINDDLGKFPEILFVDINMPGMDGWEFLDSLAEYPEFILNNVKVCMLTSSIDEHDIEKSKKYPMVCDFITKPLLADKLESLFSSVIKIVPSYH